MWEKYRDRAEEMDAMEKEVAMEFEMEEEKRIVVDENENVE